MGVRLLGPLDVRFDGVPVRVPAGRLRVVVAVLALRAGRVVSVDELREALWGDPAAGSPATVRSYIRRLREVLPDPEVVRGVAPGYLLAIPREDVDVLLFDSLVEQARSADDPTPLLEQAVGLWSGEPPLADIRSESVQRDVVPALVERGLAASEHLMDAWLSAGRHDDAIGWLTHLTREHPLRERFWFQFMSALRHAGRRADALAAYQDARKRLATELGIDVGAELQALHQEILAGDTSEPRVRRVPGQLVADIPDFTGRAGTVADVERHLTEAGVVVLSGQPGAGKTALAVHIAHRVGDQFPDGHLFARLRDPGPDSTLAAEAVLARFLRALGVTPAELPAGAAEQAALYRSLLRDRRVLVVLDDAENEEQVRPLVPGGRGCAVLVTSRVRLDGLVALDGALSVPVSPLDPADSLRLLERLVPRQSRVDDLAALADECAHLPLALRIASAHLRTRPEQSIRRYVEELRRVGTVRMLRIPGDPQASVAEAFDVSHRRLTPECARVFALLGLLGGPDVGVPVVADLAALPPDEARSLLEDLARVNLIVRVAPDRYGMHDLLRDYAAGRHVDPLDADAARARVLEHYLRRAASVDCFVRRPVQPDSCDRMFVDREAAVAWYEVERENLVPIVRMAIASGLRAEAVRLTILLAAVFGLRKHWAEWIATHRLAVAAARAEGDRDSERALLHKLGEALEETGRCAEALAVLGSALAMADDDATRAAVLNSIGVTHRRRGDDDQAACHHTQALELFRRVGDRHGEAAVLVNISRLHTRRGDHARAIASAHRAIDATTRFGDAHHTTIAWINLAEAYRAMGETDQALETCHTALDLARRCQDRHGEALARRFLSTTRIDDDTNAPLVLADE